MGMLNIFITPLIGDCLVLVVFSRNDASAAIFSILAW